MKNFNFNVLPIEIRREIHGIRLSNALKKNYYRRRAKKFALIEILMKLEKSYEFMLYQFGGDVSMPYFNPLNSNVRYVAERFSQVLTEADTDNDIFWISQLITPLEQGLIIKQRESYFEPTFDWTQHLGTARRAIVDAMDNYQRTEHAVALLIEVFGCRRNPHRQRIDWPGIAGAKWRSLNTVYDLFGMRIQV